MYTFHMNCILNAKEKLNAVTYRPWCLISLLECMNHIFMYLTITSPGLWAQIRGIILGSKIKFFLWPKNYCTWKSIDHNVWNQNIAELSLIFIELYHYEEARSDTHFCVADASHYNIHFCWATSKDFYSFKFINMCFYTYLSMYWHM